jgi:hypothetical protein
MAKDYWLKLSLKQDFVDEVPAKALQSQMA